MITSLTVPLTILRHQPFVYTIAVRTHDLTEATIEAHIRLYRDAPGEPLAAMEGVDDEAVDGITVTVEDVDGSPYSTIRLFLTEATVDAILPFEVDEDGRPNRKAGAAVEACWDLHVTLPAEPKARWLEGPATLVPGATFDV